MENVDELNRFACLADALDAAAEGDTGYNFYGAKGELEHELPYRSLQRDAKVLARKLKSLDLPRGCTHGDRGGNASAVSPLLLRLPVRGAHPRAGAGRHSARRSGRLRQQLRLRLLQSCLASVAVAPEGFVEFLDECRSGPLELKLCGGVELFDALPESDAELKPLTTGEACLPAVHVRQHALSARRGDDPGSRHQQPARDLRSRRVRDRRGPPRFLAAVLSRHGPRGFRARAAVPRPVRALPEPAHLCHAARACGSS